MNISRGEVNEFRFSSAMAASTESFLNIGTANTENTVVRITDLKMSCGGSARTVKLYCASYGTAGQALEFDLPANSVTDLKWDIPPKFLVAGTTGQVRNMVSSATGTGVKFTVSGYIEK